MATILLPIITSDPEEVPDMDEISETIESKQTEGKVDVSVAQYTSTKTFDAYAERMIGVCEDMCSLGYI